MPCIKCGKDTVDKNVFCPECLEQMEAYPVKPGTPVLIPQHSPTRRYQTRKLRAPEPEEIIRRQKRVIRLLTVCVCVLLVAWAITTAMVIHSMLQEESVPIGQNFGYTTSQQGARR